MVIISETKIIQLLDVPNNKYSEGWYEVIEDKEKQILC